MKEIQDCIDVHGITPMALLLQSVPNEHLKKTVAVHCTHTSQHDLEQFIAAGGKVCICPLTEASLGDGIFKSVCSTDGYVSLGTDCNARIDMFEEMRWLEYSQRLRHQKRGVYASTLDDFDINGFSEGKLANQLLKCATISGAEALGIHTGSIEKGKFADFALLDLNASAISNIDDENLLGAVIFGGSAEGLVVNTCVSGTWSNENY